MADILGQITVDNILIINTDTTPVAGIGNVPVGSIITASDGSGFFYKTGSGVTDYTKIPVSNSDVTDTLLTGFVVGANSTITATDDILSAFEKTQGQLNAIVSSSHPAVTIGTSNGLSIVGATQVLSLGLSSGSTTGALSSVDWTIFNNKQNDLGYTPVNKAGDNGVGLLHFSNNQGIDVDSTGGTDTLNVGATNADVINIGTGLNQKTINVGSATTLLDNINIYGNVFSQEVTNLLVKDKLFTVNDGGAVASGFNAGFEIEEGGFATGYFMTNTNRDGWDFKAPAVASVLTLSLLSLTANRTLTAPDVTGIIATTNGGQIFTSATWNATLIGVAYGGTGTSTQFTSGSIVFAGASGVYSQDNANLFWDDTNNRLGIGTAAPTAFCDVPASTLASSSLRIRAGTAPSAPNDGDIWFDGNKFSAFRTMQYNLVGCVFTNTANSAAITNTTTETNFSLSYTFPANSLNVVGKTILIKAYLIYSNTGNPSVTFRLKKGSTTLLTAPATNLPNGQTNQGVCIEALINVRSIGAGGTVSSELNVRIGDATGTLYRGSITPSNGTQTLDTTVANTIAFSLQWGTANAANTMTMENICYEVLD